MARILFVLLLLLSSACSVEWSKPVMGNVVVAQKGHAFVCVDMPDEQQQAVKDALEEWNHALGEWKSVDFVMGHQEPCTAWIHEVTPAQSRSDGHDLARAYAPLGRSGEVKMVQTRYEEYTKLIVMHELGHVFGAQHVPGTLMNGQVGAGVKIDKCPDKTTVAQVAAWNHVPLDLLCWCMP